MAVSDGQFELMILCTECMSLLAPLDKGSKIEELVKGIRTRKGLKVGTIPGFFPQLLTRFWFVARHSAPRLLLRQVVIPAWLPNCKTRLLWL